MEGKRDQDARFFGRVEGVERYLFFLLSLVGITNYNLMGGV